MAPRPFSYLFCSGDVFRFSALSSLQGVFFFFFANIMDITAMLTTPYPCNCTVRPPEGALYLPPIMPQNAANVPVLGDVCASSSCGTWPRLEFSLPLQRGVTQNQMGESDWCVESAVLTNVSSFELCLILGRVAHDTLTLFRAVT